MKKINSIHKLIALLRVGMGVIFFYAGVTKVLNPGWSAAGYLQNTQTFSGLYEWLASPGILPYVNVLNEWGLTLIGLALILGIGARTASLFGAAMMVLYYFPILNFPYVGANSFIVDDHIIYALVLLLLYFSNAGAYWGLQGKLRK